MQHMDELRSRIARLSAGSPRPVWIEGMQVFSTERVTEPLGTVAEPVLALVAQGAKRSASVTTSSTTTRASTSS
jgi:hypothetical protein